MEGGFQRYLQLFIVYGYCVFEDDVCVDLSSVLDGRPNYANITFVGPCVDRSEVMDKGLDYAASLPSESYVGARCPLVLAPSEGATVKVYG